MPDFANNMGLWVKNGERSAYVIKVWPLSSTITLISFTPFDMGYTVFNLAPSCKCNLDTSGIAMACF